MDKFFNYYKTKTNKNTKINKYRKKNSGITLIALVVTIVILLILAGISIGALTGDNGIIDQAHTAKEDTEIASWEEQIDLAIIDAEKKHREPTLDDVKEELKNKGVIDDYSQVDKDGVITTNEPSYEIAGKLDDYVPFGPGKFANKNEEYTDENSQEEYKTVTVPEGFQILPSASEIDKGLVIEDKKGNQFVWIPVETPVAKSEAEGNTNKAMAVKVGENYRGLLYDFTDSGSTVKSGCTTTTGDYREPTLVSSDSSNGVTDLQSEYDKMIKSVSKYYGFYIGRYELGLDTENANAPTSQKEDGENGVETADAGSSSLKNWYGLYRKSKEYAPEEGTKSVVSSMTWGSQYDAMMNWMQKDKSINVTATGNRNTATATGTSETDLLKNIYDLYGCHYEWTSEAYSSNYRVHRRWLLQRQLFASG